MVAAGEDIYFHTLGGHSRRTFCDIDIHSAGIADTCLLKWAGVNHQHSHATFHK
jgi:hypothetical protein